MHAAVLWGFDIVIQPPSIFCDISGVFHLLYACNIYNRAMCFIIICPCVVTLDSMHLHLCMKSVSAASRHGYLKLFPYYQMVPCTGPMFTWFSSAKMTGHWRPLFMHLFNRPCMKTSFWTCCPQRVVVGTTGLHVSVFFMCGNHFTPSKYSLIAPPQPLSMPASLICFAKAMQYLCFSWSWFFHMMPVHTVKHIYWKAAMSMPNTC